MRIIKHGNKYSKNKIAICPLCGCEFEYNNIEYNKQQYDSVVEKV